MAYTGNTEFLSIGADGMSGAENTEFIEPEQLVECRNTSLAYGGITKEGGAAHYNAAAITGAPMIIGGWDWWPTTTSQRAIVLTSNGNAYRDTGAGTFATTLATAQGWNSTSTVTFVEGGKEAAANNVKLFFATGQAQVQVLSADGVTIAAITTPPLDWASVFPFTIENHEGRLWGGGNLNAAHTIYYSTLNNFEDFTDDVNKGGHVNIYPGEGQYITALASFRGTLVVWKYPRGIYLVDTSDANTSNWRVTRIARTIGGAGPRCWCYIENDILFMDASGTFHLLSGVQEYGDIGSSSISTRVWWDSWMKNNANMTGQRLTYVRAAYYGARKEAHFCLSGVGSTVNNMRVIWDFNRQNPRVRYDDFPSLQDIWLRLDGGNIPRLAGGDNAGFMWNIYQAAKNNNSAGYSSVIKTPPLSIGTTRNKDGDFLGLVLQPKGTWNIDAATYWDGILQETLQISMGSTGATLDSFILDTDVLAGSDVLNRRRRITGSGARFALELTGAGANQDFAITRAYFQFRPGPERSDQ